MSSQVPRSSGDPRAPEGPGQANRPGHGERSGRRTAGEIAAARFLRAFHVLLKSTRLYDRDHPQTQQSLSSAEAELRHALASTQLTNGQASRRLALRVKEGGFTLSPTASGEHFLPDHRGELKTLAQELMRVGIRTLVFAPETHLGELLNLAALLARKPAQSSMRRGSAEGEREVVVLPGEGIFEGEWSQLLEHYRIEAIHINEPLEQPRADSTLASLVAVVLAERAASLQPAEEGRDDSRGPQSLEELLAGLKLLSHLGGILAAHAAAAPQQTLLLLRNTIGAAEPGAVRVLERAIAQQGLDASQPLETYLESLTAEIVLHFVTAEFAAKRIAAQAVRPLLLQISSRIAAGSLASPRADASQPMPLLQASWTEETWAENMYERFWAALHGGDKYEVLHGHDAWCVPPGALRTYLEPAVGGSEASGREARAAVLDYSRCLLSTEAEARLATATGLSELRGLLAHIWPEKLPHEFVERVVWALADEKTPEVAGLLSAVAASLGDIAFERGHYDTLDEILAALDQAPRDDEHAHLHVLSERLTQERRWQKLVDTSLENRHLDPALARILARDPDRLLESLSARLAAGRLDTLPAMSRLVRTIGEALIGALVGHLYDPRNQLAGASVKLLGATKPERLLEALPRALPSWDWNLQDLAVSELISSGGQGAAGLQACADAFLAALPHAHPLVVPMMVDQIGLAKKIEAVPILVEVASGRQERLKDVFVRIKAIEALGRIGPASGADATDLLRQILRERRGLTHVEPAGLRAAAEEALGLIENWPSSVRVRTAREALEKASVTHSRPRRYLRIPLDSPLPATIVGPPESSARVRTISMGGALLESSRRLNVGEAFEVEIKAGLRSIHGKAVVRNVGSSGSGVEFVHMKQDDREKLRKFVSKLLKE